MPVVAAAEINSGALLHHEKEARLPIVMYHLVTEKSKYIGKFGIPPSELRKDFEYLRENNYTTIVMQDLINFVDYKTDLPEKPIMLTFDDGNTSDFEHVLPLLEKYNMRAVIAVLGETADRFTAQAEKCAAGARFPHLTWQQIEALHASGRAEIQSHSYNLHTPPIGSGKKSGESAENYHARLRKDLMQFQKACAARLDDYVPTTFVYPLGVIGENSRAVLEEIGMVASISCQEGMNTIRQGDRDCLFRLKRTNRPHGRGIEEIIKTIK
jgi:peptidoglycan/xylan/chitin deacetylase (PgdA/CDA1 family)